ncbi:MAG: YbgC/FadM family acyl-CoA thioesterase [Pseudomonadota bacterium]
MTHSLDVRVHYEDTDMAGVVYYANYLKFIERGRSEALRESGVDQREMRNAGVVFVVKSLTAEYHAPAHYDDILTVETDLVELKRASAVLSQAVLLQGAPVFSSEVRIAAMTTGGKPVRLPEIAVRALEALND